MKSVEHFEGIKLSPDLRKEKNKLLATPQIYAPIQSLNNTSHQKRDDSQSSDFFAPIANQDESSALLNQLSNFKSTSSFLKQKVAMDNHLNFKH